MNKNRDRDERDNATAPTMASAPGVDVRANTAPNDLDPLIGQTVAERYKIISLLGRGGMGTVYACEHIQLRKRMALKMLAEELRQTPEQVTRFLTEARAAAQIGHPNIVDVYDLGELPGGGAYIAMALLDGEDLQEALRDQGAMPFVRARQIVGPICRALAAAHQKGVVHRDMKPANVFLSRDADGAEVVKVLDFGIAQVNHGGEGEAARLTQTGAIVGTPAFMSPEQGRGQRTDHRTDVYSVGCILYNLLTGDVPFRGETLMGVISQHLFDDPEPPSSRAPAGAVSQELDAVVLRALAKEPAERFQTMKELWVALEACGESPAEWPEPESGRYQRLSTGGARSPVRAPVVVGTTSPDLPRSARSRWPILVGATVLVAGGAIAWLALKPAVQPISTPAPSISPAPLANPAPVANPAPTPREVTLEIKTTPPGATVWRGGEDLGRTPLKLMRERGAEAVSLRVTRDGYEDQQLSLPLDRDRVVELRLAAKVEARPERPVGKAAAKTGGKSSRTGKNGDLKDPFR